MQLQWISACVMILERQLFAQYFVLIGQEVLSRQTPEKRPLWSSKANIANTTSQSTNANVTELLVD